jgi:hypothetical protein
MQTTMMLVFALALVGNPTRCTTVEEPTLGRLQTLCSDGTRAISCYNRMLDRGSHVRRDIIWPQPLSVMA